MSTGRMERLLPWACAAAAVVLFGSQLMTIFELTPQGGEPLQERTMLDHHGPALMVVAGFALLAIFATVFAASQPASVAVAAMGILSVLFFLVIDLPDAGQIGTIDDSRQSFIDAEAVPQAGFWFELLGSLGLAMTGGALATMSQEQLAALRGKLFRRGTPKPKPKAPAAKTAPKSRDAA
jgi:hypothetical protein